MSNSLESSFPSLFSVLRTWSEDVTDFPAYSVCIFALLSSVVIFYCSTHIGMSCRSIAVAVFFLMLAMILCEHQKEEMTPRMSEIPVHVVSSWVCFFYEKLFWVYPWCPSAGRSSILIPPVSGFPNLIVSSLMSLFFFKTFHSALDVLSSLCDLSLVFYSSYSFCF